MRRSIANWRLDDSRRCAAIGSTRDARRISARSVPSGRTAAGPSRPQRWAGARRPTSRRAISRHKAEPWSCRVPACAASTGASAFLLRGDWPPRKQPSLRVRLVAARQGCGSASYSPTITTVALGFRPRSANRRLRKSPQMPSAPRKSFAASPERARSLVPAVTISRALLARRFSAGLPSTPVAGSPAGATCRFEQGAPGRCPREVGCVSDPNSRGRLRRNSEGSPSTRD